jgi:hypothetical protein
VRFALSQDSKSYSSGLSAKKYQALDCLNAKHLTPDEIAARSAQIKAHVDDYHRYKRLMERIEGRVKKGME